MNAVRSNIFQMPVAEWKPGYCWICEDVSLLKFRDTSTGQCIGACCLESTLVADKTLHFSTGIRKPNPSENIPNH